MTDLSPEQIRSLGSQALLITFVITAALGAIMQRTNFCTLGAFDGGLVAHAPMVFSHWYRNLGGCLHVPSWLD
ncbi:MAG: hypothetical protein RL533_1472 [Pseudomonadota bacterium]